MSRDLVDDVSVVVRQSGERTAAHCRALLEGVFEPAAIATIREAPFSAALRRTYEVGLDARRPWTLAVDADILVEPGALLAWLVRARRAPTRVFELQAQILDKPFGGPRTGGPHLYRTRDLSRALRFVETSHEQIRPEYHVLRHMAAAGRPWRQDPDVLGLHDFEQFYRDLFRKAWVHARKHERELRILEPMWRRLAVDDADFAVLLRGLEAGRLHRGALRADARAFPEKIDSLLARDGLAEKPPLASHAGAAEAVAERMARFAAPPEYAQWRERALAEQEAERRRRLAADTWGARSRRLARRLLPRAWRRALWRLPGVAAATANEEETR